MRLVYRPDAEGRIQPVLERGVPGHPRVAGYTRDVGSAVPTEGEERRDGAHDDSGCWLDPEYHQHLAEDWELEPRRSHVPVALVVAADPEARTRI